MALRAPPRSPPFTDYDDMVDELSKQFNVFGPDGEPMKPPKHAAEQWTAPEIQMWFASGGAIEPPDDPKLRAAAAACKADIRSAEDIEAEARVKEAQKAARQAPYFKNLTDRDIKKADMYRDMAFTTGHFPRDVGDLFPVDDKHLRALHKTKHCLPFEKHLLLWNDDEKNGPKVVKHPPEGFTHGSSAALRGVDMRFFWDASNLKVVGALRYSLAAVIGWRHDDKENWSSGLVHGGCVELVLDELTAEVMKVNVAPQNLTSEISFKLKKPSYPDVTYKLEAEVTECSPPRCMVVGRILNMEGEVVAEATAKMAMADRLGDGADPGATLGPPVDPQDAEKFSLTRNIRRAGGGGGRGVDISDGGGGGGGGGGAGGGGGGGLNPSTPAETMSELKRLQKLLVTQLQNEYYCDDLEPPPEAFGWDDQKLTDYFENGGA
jgi:acyl-coenzyme A thioesterase PaaI-like protein